METPIFFKLSIQNNTKIADDSNIFVLGKGQDPAYRKSDHFDTIESYLVFDAEGRGSFVHADNPNIKNSDAYTQPLSSFPMEGTHRILLIPYTIGARIYFCLGGKTQFSIVEGLDEHKKVVSKSISEPDPFNPADPSYAMLYDKIEFTFTHDDKKNLDNMYIDTTAVDFFNMPISLTGTEDGQHTPVTKGLGKARADVMTAMTNALTGIWNTLFVNIATAQGTALMRTVAPNKGIGNPDANKNFDSAYLKPYVAAIWSFYTKHKLKVDCSELIDVDYQLTDIEGGKLTEKLDNAVFTGSVLEDGKTFRFVNKTKDIINVALPESNQVFGCDGGSMTAVPKTASSVIVREIGAAMNVGLLPLDDSKEIPTLNKAFFLSESAKGNFYKNSSQLDLNSIGQGPWYNLYSKILHSFGDPVYAFAFDDAVGQDSTLHITDLSLPCTVTLGDMTGATILNPDADKTKYTVFVTAGAGTAGTYVDANGKTQPFNDQDHQPTGPINDIVTPFVFYYDTGSGSIRYEVKLLTGAISPVLPGFVFDDSQAKSNKIIRIILPGKPKFDSSK